MEEIIDGYAEWQNRPDLTGIGRMPERAAFFRYADKPVSYTHLTLPTT